MLKIRRGVLTGLVAFAMLLASVVTAQAAPGDSSSDAERYFALIDKQMANDETYSVTAAIDNGVPRAFAIDFAAGLQVMSDKFEANDADRKTVEVIAAGYAPSFVALAACQGKNGYTFPFILLDSCVANAVSGAMAAGAGVAALAALFTSATAVPAAIAGLIAAYLSIQSGFIQVCNSWGSGVKLTPVPPTTIWVCVSQ